MKRYFLKLVAVAVAGCVGVIACLIAAAFCVTVALSAPLWAFTKIKLEWNGKEI